jgi:hypothetical protein
MFWAKTVLPAPIKHIFVMVEGPLTGIEAAQWK